jgi:hypothetical protein
MRERNVKLQNDLRKREAELQAKWVVGDRSVTWQLVGEFKSQFPAKSEESLYQMIRYYLRDGTADKRRGYDLIELQTLAISTHQERVNYAKATGRTLRTIQTAVERYRASQNRQGSLRSEEARERVLKHTEAKVQKHGYVNFGVVAELKTIDKTIEDVLKTRATLDELYGLALRIPNILYHPKTKRRYMLTTGEQAAILDDPRKFLSIRSKHISESWLIKDADPVDDPELKTEVGEIARQRVARTPKILNALKVVSATLNSCGTIDPENTFYAEWVEFKKLLNEVLI